MSKYSVSSVLVIILVLQLLGHPKHELTSGSSRRKQQPHGCRCTGLGGERERDLLAFEEVADGECVQPTKYKHVPIMFLALLQCRGHILNSTNELHNDVPGTSSVPCKPFLLLLLFLALTHGPTRHKFTSTT